MAGSGNIQANTQATGGPKSPATRNAFWGLSSSAKKLAADNGGYHDAAPWPSPVHTMLRRHVVSLRTAQNGNGDPRPDLFASPLNATSINGPPVTNVAGQVKPWTSPVPQPTGRTSTNGRIVTTRRASIALPTSSSGEKSSGSPKNLSKIPSL